MVTNLHYDICAAILLILLLLAFRFRRLVSGRNNDIFCIMIVCVLFAALFDILGESFGPIIDTKKVPLAVRYLVDSAYFILRNVTIPLFILYISAIVGVFDRYLRSKLFGVFWATPFGILVLLIIANVFNKKLFFYNKRLLYQRGSWMVWLYVIAAYYTLMAVIVLFINRKQLEKKYFIELVLFIPLNMIAAAVQMVNIRLHIDLFVTTIIFIFISMGIQRPEIFIDYRSKTYSYNAFNNQMRRVMNVKEPVSILVFKFANHKSVSSSVGFDNFTALIRKLVEAFYEDDPSFIRISELHFIDNGTYILTAAAKYEKRILQLGNRLLDYAKKPVNLGHLEIMLEPIVCYLRFPIDITSVESLVSFISDIELKLPNAENLVNLADIAATKDFMMRNDMDAIIKRGIMKNNFKMYYQPIYSVADDRFISAEALIRLVDEEYGFVSPALFIPASEKSGAIHQIGDFVFKDVCRFIAGDTFSKLGLGYIEINLSAAQCIETDLITKFNMVLIHTGVKSSQINLEITETAADYDPTITDKNINSLSDMGFSFSLDDYGTGYSNIKRVVSLPLDIVKLDKTLVDEMDDPQMWIVITNTVTLLKNMNKKILVEGVEDERALKKFVELGCDYIQGYYFSKPLPEEEFVKFILEQNAKKVMG